MIHTGMRDSAFDPDAVKQASSILDRILREEPEFWPYGLSADQFDGGLYLLSKQANTNDFFGFVGWQEREEDNKRIGYYAIGVLPEYRRQGLAKAAVQKIMREKSAGVDEVRALVVPGNAASQQLARAIPGVKLTIFEKLASIQKSALSPMTKQILGSLAGAVGTAGFFDQTAGHDRSLGSTLRPWEWDKQRSLMGVLNAGLGALGGQQIATGLMPGGDPVRNLAAGLTSIALAPGKDLMLKGTDTLNKADPMLRAITEANSRKPAAGIPKGVLYGALGLGAGALGLAGYSSMRKARAADAQAEAARGGRVKVTLPTKDPNDAETMLDIPIEEMNLSNALRARLGRDTRRKLLEETRKRTKHRNPKDPKNPTEPEKEFQQLAKEEAELDKAATTGAQAAVPSPPGQGNPALRQTQQSAAANSIDTSTAANPQIMKAQQETAEAGMQAQQQVAQAEQATQQKLMEQDKNFQQQLQQADQAKQQVVQENQVLKMQVEKAKVEGELAKSQAKAKEDFNKLKSDHAASSGGAENSQLNRLISSRLQRVQKNVTKAATAGPWNIEVDTKRNPAQPWERDALTGNVAQGSDLDAVTGRPKPPPIKALNSDAAQQINDHGNEYMAQGRASGIHLNRASYGPLLDLIHNYTINPMLTTPPAQNQDLSVIGNLSRYTQQFLHQPQF